MKLHVYNFKGLNLKISPYLHEEGEPYRCLNLEKDMVGAVKKRPGYITYLGTANGSSVTDLFTWQKDDGTTFWNYRNSGGLLYHSVQGTGSWIACDNGTISPSVHVGYAVLENTLVIGQDGGTMRHTTDGTSFTDTVGAPGVGKITSKFNRIWASGTSSDLYYSTQGTPSDWITDSSSLKIPGAGKVNQLWVAADRIVASKNSGLMFTYDDYNLRQVPTAQGPTSPYSLAETEDYGFYLNRLGYFGFNGEIPTLLSNPIERQIYNDANGGIVGTVFDNAPGVTYRYDYFCAVGDVTDDLSDELVANCIHKYDYQLNEFSDYKFNDFPTAWATFKDVNGDEKLIFGSGSNGQCFQYGGTAVSDNGAAIEAVMEGALHFSNPQKIRGPDHDKKFNFIRALANPGCQAKFQVAISDSFSKPTKKWIDVGDLKTGFQEWKFPANSRGKLLFWRLYEFSKDARFHFFGFTVDYDYIGK